MSLLLLKGWGRGRAYEAELCAAIERVVAANNQGWTQLVLELDSAYIVSLFQNPEMVVPWKYRFHREENMEADAISIFQNI